MSYQTFWHGSGMPYSKLSTGLDGGIHLGTRAQAEMRNSAFLHEVSFDTGKTWRSKDEGDRWNDKIRTARSAGFTSISYLNRLEGLTNEDVAKLQQLDVDRLTDASFRKIVPHACESVIALYAEDVRVTKIIPWKGRLTLYHGTSEANARALLEEGFSRDRWRMGANGGRQGHLYLSTSEEDARWYSNEMGEDVVLKLIVPAMNLRQDPEDATGESLVDELIQSREHGLPAKLCTTVEIMPQFISRTLGPSRSFEP